METAAEPVFHSADAADPIAIILSFLPSNEVGRFVFLLSEALGHNRSSRDLPFICKNICTSLGNEFD